ncbi:MAG: hypothetical protein C0624_08325 [Desulfuromonas sp.]|nr:MAG: hypothetical protein C0624_08325 [Desulfuromonas sp.]
MIHPTRTNLLKLKERQLAVHRSLAILKARRQALISEFLKLGEQFVDRHQQLSDLYARSLLELQEILRQEGDNSLAAIAAATSKFKGITTQPGNILGIPFLTILPADQLPRTTEERPFTDFLHENSLSHAVELFEELSMAIIKHADLESRVRRLSLAIRETTRVMRTLEDRILPRQEQNIARIRFFLAEREREGQFRLRKFKQLQKTI